jgi:pimeloyl-ACP methyl ester carboxylesterase
MRVLITEPNHPQDLPPILLIGGTAQSCTSWGGIAPAIAATGRAVVSFDARGQGAAHTCHANDFSMAAHVQDLHALITALRTTQLPNRPVDVVGFSFGGRLALAFAAQHPEFVRRAVITGVPARRDDAAARIFDSWRTLLREGNLRGMISRQIQDCHSPKFLSKFSDKQLQLLISATVAQNTLSGLQGLLRDSHVGDEAHPYHTINLAHCVTTRRIPVLLIGGAQDAVAPVKEVEWLAKDNGWNVRMMDSGHNVPAELPLQWRNCVLEHLA